MAVLYTDMAYELLDEADMPDGVTMDREEREGLTITRVTILPEGEKRMGKPSGTYVTLDGDRGSETTNPDFSKALSKELKALLKNKKGPVLAVGLGNRMVTPDSLGPRTMEQVFVTRHIHTFLPELAPEGMRQVAAFTPGVLGTTGMETAEVVKSLVAAIKPAAVLLVDALVSLRMERIASVVQLNDRGLLPGAGVGNRQKGLDETTLGVPVVALGVPTVVHASAIARAGMGLVQAHTGMGKEGEPLLAMAEELVEEAYPEVIVTPKDVDKMIGDAARRLADGINLALHGKNYKELHALLTL
jgi:spore protease